jgi:Transposase DDE domain
VPSCLLEPIWVEFSALLPDQPTFHPDHPLGCHRRRIPDRVVFDHVIAALVHGSGYERLTGPGCSDRTIRRRLKQWAAAAGLAERLHTLTLQAYDQIIGLQLEHIAVDGCITKAPSGGEVAGRSPVDRGKQGRKRSVATEAAGIPLGLVAAGANRHDSPLLAPTLQAAITQVGAMPEQVTAHLDRGYDSAATRVLLDGFGFDGEIARKGVPAPVQAGDPLGRGTNPRVDERLRQAAALHRTRRQDRGLLPVSRRRVRGRPPAHPASPNALPVGHPPHHQTPQMTRRCWSDPP